MAEVKDKQILPGFYTEDEFNELASELKLKKLDGYTFSEIGKLDIYESYDENNVGGSRRFFVEELDNGNYLVHNVYNLQPEDVQVKTAQALLRMYIDHE
jgi:hypothetical protein